MKLLISFRIEQWLKNIVLFAALIFSAKAIESESVLLSVAAFFIFCGLSSALYLFNDICDRDRDKAHPIKKYRPIASGRVQVSTALITAAILAAAGITASFCVNRPFATTALFYFVLNLLYSLFLKRVVILDVMIISFGFVLRAIAGANAINVHISPWLILCTMLLALFLGLAKRRHELIIMNDNAFSHRELFKEYTPYFLDQMISIVTASTLILYILYTMLGEVRTQMNIKYLEWTTPFVLYGIFRYLYLVHRKHEGGSPAKTFLSDHALLMDVLLWAAVSVYLIYFR